MVYCTTESVQAAILFWPQVAADLKKKKKKAKSILKTFHSKSVVKQVHSHLMILTCSKAATWNVHYTACKHMTHCLYLVLKGNWGIKWREDIAIITR